MCMQGDEHRSWSIHPMVLRRLRTIIIIGMLGAYHCWLVGRSGSGSGSGPESISWSFSPDEATIGPSGQSSHQWEYH